MPVPAPTTGGTTDPDAAPTPSVAAPDTPTPTAAAPSAVSGTVTFGLVGSDYPSVASWIENLSKDPSLDPDSIWVSTVAATATGAEGSAGTAVTFSSTAKLTDAARSNRLDTYLNKGAK